ncbi:MAG: hypothetical protein ACRCVA_09640 [Phreatobacter sp.]
MKTVLTFLLAYLLSMMAGAVIITWIADKSGGDETFILAFMAEALLASIVTLVLAIAYVAAPRPGAIAATALVLIGLYLALMAAIVGYDAWAGGFQLAWSALPLFAAAGLSGLVVIAIQWWLISRRALRVAGGRPIVGEAAG